MSILKERVTLPVSFPIICRPGARETTMGGTEWMKRIEEVKQRERGRGRGEEKIDQGKSLSDYV